MIAILIMKHAVYEIADRTEIVLVELRRLSKWKKNKTGERYNLLLSLRTGAGIIIRYMWFVEPYSKKGETKMGSAATEGTDKFSNLLI